jgi:hypothetical protein
MLDDPNSNPTDALAVAAFAADGLAILTEALVMAGRIPVTVAHDIALRAEKAAGQAGDDHGAQLMRIRSRLASLNP